jgi:hypothetical protein
MKTISTVEAGLPCGAFAAFVTYTDGTFVACTHLFQLDRLLFPKHPR